MFAYELHLFSQICASRRVAKIARNIVTALGTVSLKGSLAQRGIPMSDDVVSHMSYHLSKVIGCSLYIANEQL